MKISYFAVVSLAVTLAGCSTVGQVAPPLPVTGEEVFTAVACDLLAAVNRHPELDNNWAAGVTITFSQSSNIILKPTASWSTTIGIVKIGSSPSLTTSSVTQNSLGVTANYVIETNALAKACPAPDPSVYARGLGVSAALVQDAAWTAGLPDGASVVSKPATDVPTYTDTFTVSHTADGQLNFTMGPVSIKTDGTSATNSGSNAIRVIFSTVPQGTPHPKIHALISRSSELLDQLNALENADDQQRNLTQALQNALVGQ